MAPTSTAVRSPARQQNTLRKLEEPIPLLLRPVLRAFILGYGSAVAPRVLTLVLQHVSRLRQRSKNAAAAKGRVDGVSCAPHEPFFVSLGRLLRGGLDPQRFPTFCAALVGGSTLFEVIISKALSTWAQSISPLARIRLSRWFATFTASWLSLTLLQSKPSQAFSATVVEHAEGATSPKEKTIRYAGRSLDLTLFAVTRALDVIVGELWARRKQRRLAAGKSWTAAESALSKLADPAMFATSCAFIMWAWFYHPYKLRRAYYSWIKSAAAVDLRLIKALQRCRSGELRYGEDTGQAPLLQEMCRDYKWPLAWGDPAVAVPFPCEMVHMGRGPSCEYHALARFLRSFKWAMATYLPLNLILVARSPGLASLRKSVKSAARSSAFLGAYIALFYYGVCLARTRLGPHVLGKDTAARQRIDSGICVGTGCALCGWSILIEKPGRVANIGLFVAPRAMATLLPRRYPWDKQWRETAVFAASTAVVFTCVLENKARVRGFLGTVLATVLEP
ncbi:uncharacterized protein B0I36DRAFT_10678 [Microdochium trichocladiopsis]|uniref:Integral membrane protein n=1 Tax=Microdochium trichocladiopsis TaxID=1682393 RepID=A0A9P8YHN5_9PEZI|nr:uncharacterized protein B0I36DRAFT_10678 [Microdochium trichocladiopsis]KAH7040460.1 hypothetical protein B0I36DRAFT_10678 [Microdochium trichocladiopsis]